MIVLLLIVFAGLFGLVIKDLLTNKGSTADWWISLLLLGLTLVWAIGIMIVENPFRPLENLHDMLMKIPALHPYIDS